MNVKFSKIRYDGEEVLLGYAIVSEHATSTGELKSSEAPEPEFVEALRAFRPELRKVFGFPGDYAKDCAVTQVSISEKQDRKGIVISAKLAIAAANSPALFHTPYLPEPGDGNGEGCMSGNMVQKLDRLIAAAHLYYEGRRAQMELLEDDDTPKRREQQEDLVDQIDDVTRKRKAKEAREALTNMLLDAFPAETFESCTLTDNEIARGVLDAFDDVPDYIDPDDSEKVRYPGVFGHLAGDPRSQAGAEHVWCAVRTNGGVARFWYDINPTIEFEAMSPTLMTHDLIALVRSLRGIKNPDALEVVSEETPMLETEAVSAGDD